MSNQSNFSAIGALQATVGIGQYIVNDYVLTLEPLETGDGYTLTIRKGSDVQTVTLEGLSEENLEIFRGYVAAAQAAQLAAEGAQTAAETAQGKAEDAQDAAEAAQSLAETAQAAAETAETNAGASATQAGTSASSAAQSATQAAGSAAAAAQTLTDVQAAGQAQIAAIGAEGERVLETIPEDYTELSGDVSNLKTEMGDLDDLTTTAKSNLVAAINEVAHIPPVSVEFSADNTYINGSGVAEPDSNFFATDYIDLDDVIALSYTGKMGSTMACMWYDEEKTYIDKSLYLNNRTAAFENVMIFKPSGARYVRLQSRKPTVSNPPTRTPEVTVYYDPDYITILGNGIVGDGVVDDTLAVQRMVNMSESVTLPPRDQILITAPIDVRVGYARVLNGNGSGIIVSDDFCALSVTGTLRTSSDATNMDAFVVKNEAGMLIENFRITAQDTTEGCGIELTKGFKTKLCNNYIHHMKNGIRLYDRNRDIIISENNIFAHTENGILFDAGVNLHQCNIINNMIQYAHDNIHVYHPGSIANFQIVGNDIEIDAFPPSTYATATCINFESYASTSQFSEIVISGNTIQGHQSGQDIVVLAGVDGHEIKHLSFTGNHVSNADRHGINMAYVENVSFSGNNYAVLDGYVYGMSGACTNIVISGESAERVGGKIQAESTAVLNGIKCRNVQFLTNDRNNILTGDVTDVDIFDETDIMVSGLMPVITAVPNATYICAEVSALSFTPCANGECEVIFSSGVTPTTLTVPNTVIWSGDFDPTELAASTTYALKVRNGVMGVATTWPYPSYGGIPIYIDNKYFPSSSGQKISEALGSNDWFLAGPFNVGSTDAKQMTYSQIYADIQAALCLFNDINGRSVDYWSNWGPEKPSSPSSKTVTTPGQYIVTSVLKSRAADFYMMDANGNYIVKGNNVT